MPAPSTDTYARLLTYVAFRESDGGFGSRESKTITEVFSGNALSSIPVGTAEDTVEIVAKARAAQPQWAQRSLAERAGILKAVSKGVYSKRNEILDVIQAETGKNRASANEEVLDVLLTARHYAARGPEVLRSKLTPGMLPFLTKTAVHRQPKGVVGVISPWNYPLTLALSDAIAALMAGNAVVIKPDSQTPFSCLAAAEILYRAGVPREIFAVVPGPGSVVGDALTKNVDYLMFTGSSKTGRVLGGQAGERLIGFSAELGGKNPMIVTREADPKRVAEIATRALYSNSGQLCVSIERIYVEKPAVESVTAALVTRIRQMDLASGYEFGPEMGSLISQSQLDTVNDHVNDAVDKGATVLVGGKARPDLGPLFYEPTLLANVPETAKCHREETFGPVAAIYPVDSIDEAINEANDTEFGLNASVFAGTDAQGEAIAKQLRVGTVNVGEGYAAAWGSLAAPMGGMGISGVGRRHGDGGLLKYTEAQTVATQRLLHLGGPELIPRRQWQRALTPLANALKLFPGR